MHQSQRNGRLNYLDSFVNIFWPLIVPYILWIGRTLIIRTRRDHNVKLTVQSWRFCRSRTRNQTSSCFSRLTQRSHSSLATCLTSTSILAFLSLGGRLTGLLDIHLTGDDWMGGHTLGEVLRQLVLALDGHWIVLLFFTNKKFKVSLHAVDCCCDIGFLNTR